MRTALVIVPSPRVDLAPGVGQRQEPMGVQAFIAEPAIERFHKSIVRWLAWPREVERHAILIGPTIQDLRDELRAIVHAYGPRGAPFRYDPDQGFDDLLPFDALVDVDRQGLAGISIDHGQGAQPTTIEQGIGHVSVFWKPQVMLLERWPGCSPPNSRA